MQPNECPDKGYRERVEADYWRNRGQQEALHGGSMRPSAQLLNEPDRTAYINGFNINNVPDAYFRHVNGV